MTSTKQPECVVKRAVVDQLEEVFIRQKIGHRIILISMNDFVQIQSVTASLSYERV